MSIINSIPPMMGASGASGASGFVIEGSGLFLGDDDYLQRTPASAGNRHVFTYATTLKRPKLGAAQTIFDAGAASGDNFAFIFDANDKISLSDIGGARFVTTPVFRDTSSYYHIVLAVHSNGASGDTVPAMTSLTAPSGTVTAEGQGEDSPAWHVFNDANSTNWLHASSTTSWLAYEFPSNTYPYITAYTIKARSGGLGQMPKTWTFQGWNGSAYVTLDTQTNAGAWSNNEVRSYSLSSATSAYNKFRWNITVNQGDPHVGFEEAQIIGLNPFITPANQCKLYVNGTQITSFATNNISSMSGSQSPNNTVLQTVGRRGYGSANDYDGYIAQAIMIDGLQLTPSSFGETSDDGFWQINDPSELTFGTNGFLLSGQNLSTGADTSIDNVVTGYAPVSVTFDGTNDSLERGAALTGLSNSKSAFASIWFKRNTTGSQNIFLQSNSGGFFNFSILADNRIEVIGYNSGYAFMTKIHSSAITDVGNWHHCMWSFNGTTQHMYVDGVSDLASTNNVDGNVNWAADTQWVMGKASYMINADIADFIFDDTYVDLSDADNRAKFITTGGAPVDPGDDGATAMGASPLIYLNSNALATWHTNSGTGGGFTETGALTAGATVTKAVGNHFTKSGTITATNDSPTNGDA
jgi:hypothetical protein